MSLSINRVLSFAFILITLSACEVGSGGSTSFGDGGGDGTWTTSTITDSTSGSDTGGSGETGDDPGYTPDPEVCEATPCSTPDDCCQGYQPGLPSACPSAGYPDNWTCENQMCVHGGCSSDVDCVFSGFECINLGTVSQCVAPCSVPSGIDDLDDCDDRQDEDSDGLAHYIPGTECIGVAAGGVRYCAQPFP